jgi:hypothetical protein
MSRDTRRFFSSDGAFLQCGKEGQGGIAVDSFIDLLKTAMVIGDVFTGGEFGDNYGFRIDNRTFLKLLETFLDQPFLVWRVEKNQLKNPSCRFQ